MSTDETPQDLEQRVRALAEKKGYQLRHADGKSGRWNLVNPTIDGKAYGFSFSQPRSFTLEQAEELLKKKPDR